MRRPLPPPHIAGYTRITTDGHEKRLSGTDGSRLYFTQMQPKAIAQVGVAGGDVAQIPVAVPGIFYLLDVAPDGSRLLIASIPAGAPHISLWEARTLGGSLRRIGYGLQAAYSPDGKLIAFLTEDGELWVIQGDGSGGGKLASPGQDARNPNWSPDGSAIRFDKGGSLWEIASNGSNLRQLLPGWHTSSGQCCGRWTPDGRFYLFLSPVSSSQGSQIWALDERRGWLRHPPKEPVQLTSGPISWSQPIPGKDGKQIFSLGRTLRGELSRLDPGSKQFLPFLGGIAAEGISFSKDGRFVAYVSYPDGILWKANRDGSKYPCN